MLRDDTRGLVASEHADAIYHADLFMINGRTWMIGGSGRSTAARIASGGEGGSDLGRDSVAVVRVDDTLHGRHDPGAVPGDPLERDRHHPLRRLDAIAYCLNETETATAYVDRPIAIARVDNKMLAWMLASQIYPAQLAPLYFPPGEVSRLISRKRRVLRFLQLTDGAVGTRFLVVPWMSTVEAKAALYANYG